MNNKQWTINGGQDTSAHPRSFLRSKSGGDLDYNGKQQVKHEYESEMVVLVWDNAAERQCLGGFRVSSG